MRKRHIYLIAGAAALVAAAGIAIAAVQATTSDGPESDHVVSPESEAPGQLEGDELSDHWDSSRMSEAEPPDMGG